MQTFSRSFLKGMWNLTRTYWSSEEKWRARLLLAVIVALNLGHVYILVLINEWYNRFYNALQSYDKDAFFHELGIFSMLAAVFIVVAVYELYLQQMLQIKWRRWMTERYLKEWLGDRAYYRMQLVDNRTDNPDQRISEDLQLFVSLTLRLSLGLLKATVTLVSFVAILWKLSGSITVPLGQYQLTVPGYMVWVAIVYSIIGTWLTAKIGRPLVGLNFNQQRYEADFRFSLVRLRENSESIAFYGGERQEELNFANRFKKIFENFYQLMKRQKKLTWFTAGYGQIAIIFPIVVAAPRYFSNQIQLGGLLQTSSAFGKVQDALSFFVESYTLLAEWQAVVNRLTGFVNNMNQVRSMPEQDAVKVIKGTSPAFAVAGLDVGLPNGQRLLENLELKIKTGESLLITGPSGCGKSTLMRTLAGIWPFGQGNISIPEGQRMLFLPQKSYLPLGSLRDVLLYPNSTGAVSDELIKEVLILCKLNDFTDKLDEVQDWSHILSLGEQQRVAFARALLLKPQWLFLDEATSALDEPTERVMYKLLQERLKDTSIISIGHRNTLTGYHKVKLSLDGSGKWSLLNR